MEAQILFEGAISQFILFLGHKSEEAVAVGGVYHLAHNGGNEYPGRGEEENMERRAGAGFKVVDEEINELLGNEWDGDIEPRRHRSKEQKEKHLTFSISEELEDAAYGGEGSAFRHGNGGVKMHHSGSPALDGALDITVEMLEGSNWKLAAVALAPGVCSSPSM